MLCFFFSGVGLDGFAEVIVPEHRGRQPEPKNERSLGNRLKRFESVFEVAHQLRARTPEAQKGAEQEQYVCCVETDAPRANRTSFEDVAFVV